MSRWLDLAHFFLSRRADSANSADSSNRAAEERAIGHIGANGTGLNRGERPIPRCTHDADCDQVQPHDDHAGKTECEMGVAGTHASPRREQDNQRPSCGESSSGSVIRLTWDCFDRGIHIEVPLSYLKARLG